jgi:hypothetical protein
MTLLVAVEALGVILPGLAFGADRYVVLAAAAGARVEIDGSGDVSHATTERAASAAATALEAATATAAAATRAWRSAVARHVARLATVEAGAITTAAATAAASASAVAARLWALARHVSGLLAVEAGAIVAAELLGIRTLPTHVALLAAVEAGAGTAGAASFGLGATRSSKVQSDLLPIHLLTVQFFFGFGSFIMRREINMSEALRYSLTIDRKVNSRDSASLAEELPQAALSRSPAHISAEQ